MQSENDFDFLGLLTEEINGKKDKSNGAIRLDEDNIYLEKRSRFNGKVKDSYEINYDGLNENNIIRTSSNRIEIDLGDRKLNLRTMDHGMLDEFYDKFLNKIGVVIGDNKSESMDSSSSNPVQADIPDQIRKYHELFKDGIITEEEFEAKKKELLEI